MMKKLIPLILVLFGGAAIAAGGSAEFDEVDTNQDGTISQEEAQAAGMEDLSTYDANQDGQLSEEEYETAKSQQSQ